MNELPSLMPTKLNGQPGGHKPRSEWVIQFDSDLRARLHRPYVTHAALRRGQFIHLTSYWLSRR